MLCTPTFLSLLGGLALLVTCKAESHAGSPNRLLHRHARHLQHGIAINAMQMHENIPRHDADPAEVVIVTQTVYKTTYLGYYVDTPHTTTTTTILETISASPDLITTTSGSVVIIYSQVPVLPVPLASLLSDSGSGSAVTNTFSPSSTSTSSSSSSSSSSSHTTLITSVKPQTTHSVIPVAKETALEEKKTTTHPTIAAAKETSSKMIIPTSSIITAALSSTSIIAPSPIANSGSGPAQVNQQYASVASAAIAALAPSYSGLRWSNVNGWKGANAYNDIMNMDFWTGSKQFESTYGAALFKVATDPNAQGQVLSTDGFMDDQLWWCLAMIKGYQNYGHEELLNQASKQWKNIQAMAQVFRSDQGTTPNKNGIRRSIRIPSNCDVDGGVYWSQQPDSSINAISTGLFAQVGAQLYALTGDNSFKSGADSALGWLTRTSLSQSTGVMNVDSWTMDDCGKHLGSLTYNTGVYIGALSTLYAKTGSSSYLDPLLKSVESAVTGSFGNDNPPLVITQQDDLTSNVDDVQWRDVLFRNLADFYVTNPGQVSSDLKSKMQAFFKANYNQIQSKAKFGNLYAANWFGLIQGGSDWGTVSVLSCLQGAMLLL